MDGFRDFVDDWRVRRLDEQSAVSPVRRSVENPPDRERPAAAAASLCSEQLTTSVEFSDSARTGEIQIQLPAAKLAS
ncbi:unnamed protein product [Sphagnum troendelagicum]